MNESARRVALALIVVSFFTLGYSTFVSNRPVCSGFASCGATLTLYSSDLGTPAAQSTMQGAQIAADDNGFLNQLTQIVSLYAFIVGLCLLLSLEISKPHYIKNSAKKSKRRRAA